MTSQVTTQCNAITFALTQSHLKGGTRHITVRLVNNVAGACFVVLTARLILLQSNWGKYYKWVGIKRSRRKEKIPENPKELYTHYSLSIDAIYNGSFVGDWSWSRWHQLHMPALRWRARVYVHGAAAARIANFQFNIHKNVCVCVCSRSRWWFSAVPQSILK